MDNLKHLISVCKKMAHFWEL